MWKDGLGRDWQNRPFQPCGRLATCRSSILWMFFRGQPGASPLPCHFSHFISHISHISHNFDDQMAQLRWFTVDSSRTFGLDPVKLSFYTKTPCVVPQLNPLPLVGNPVVLERCRPSRRWLRSHSLLADHLRNGHSGGIDRPPTL